MSGAQEKISSLKSARGEEARVDSFFFLSKKAGEREGCVERAFVGEQQRLEERREDLKTAPIVEQNQAPGGAQ